MGKSTLNGHKRRPLQNPAAHTVKSFPLRVSTVDTF
nr:MAG TPA_asm: hypothetical protein [Caudoviricetes sp.]